MKLGITVNAAQAHAQMKATLANAKRSILAGVQGKTTEGKESLRDATRRVLKGNKLPTSWQAKIFGKESFNPAGLIYSKAPEIMRAFSEGATIKNPDGFWLPVPTDNCPKSYNGKRVTPSNWPKEVYGPLTFIWIRSQGRGVLAAMDPPNAKTMAATRRILGRRQIRGGASATKLKDMTKRIMFNLVPQVTLKKLLDPAALGKAAGDGIPAAISAELEKGKNG
ncbi:MAG: DUF6441 family protein [Alphaproteobacteria bacterium]